MSSVKMLHMHVSWLIWAEFTVKWQHIKWMQKFCRDPDDSYIICFTVRNKINPNHASVWGKQSSISAFVRGYASAFSLWLNSVYLSVSHFRIMAKRMNMKVMGKRNENEGWVSLGILRGKPSTWSASMSVKFQLQWWWLIRFSHAQQIALIGRNILQLNSQLTYTDSIVNRVSCAAC